MLWGEEQPRGTRSTEAAMQRAILALALAGSAAAFVAPQVCRPGGG